MSHPLELELKMLENQFIIGEFKKKKNRTGAMGKEFLLCLCWLAFLAADLEYQVILKITWT